MPSPAEMAAAALAYAQEERRRAEEAQAREDKWADESVRYHQRYGAPAPGFADERAYALASQRAAEHATEDEKWRKWLDPRDPRDAESIRTIELSRALESLKRPGEMQPSVSDRNDADRGAEVQFHNDHVDPLFYPTLGKPVTQGTVRHGAGDRHTPTPEEIERAMAYLRSDRR